MSTYREETGSFFSMDKKHTIHLPNGKSYTVIVTEEPQINEIRDFMANHTAVTIRVELAPGTTHPAKLAQEASLLLWGDVLKNSYITVE